MLRRRNPYTIPLLPVAVGGGLVAYHGETLYRFEPMSERQIEQQAIQQLEALEERRGPHLSPIQGERRQALEQRLQAEIRGVHERPRREAERWFFAGLAALIIGLGHGLSIRWMTRQEDR